MKRSRKERRRADIPSSRLRFVFEAAFLIVVAVGALLMQLSVLTIVLLIGAAWILVALIERASYRHAGPGPRADEEEQPPPPPTPAAAFEGEARPSRSRVQRGEAPEPEPAPEPAPRKEPAAAAGSPEAGPVVTKRPLDLPGLEPPPAPPVQPARRGGALARAARRVVPPAPAPASAPAPPPPAREWNLWDLERRAREQAGTSPRAEEWSALFTHLRVFASPDGILPKEFDELVRESFGELIETA